MRNKGLKTNFYIQGLRNKVVEGQGEGQGFRDKCLGTKVEEQAIDITKVEEQMFRDKYLRTRYEEQAINDNS
jgi:hypothetical protein